MSLFDLLYRWRKSVWLLGAPLVCGGLAVLARMGHLWCLTVLAALTAVLLSARIIVFYQAIQEARKEHELPPCTEPCGCEYLVATYPEGDCGRQCDCGCGRACTTHKNHRGRHAS
jgi:hypothetical protein